MALLSLVLTAGSASAQTNYYWNAPAGGDGLWDLELTNWATATGGPVNYIWVGDGTEIANFGNTAGTVTLDTDLAASSVVFSATGYTLTGGVLTLAGTGGVIDTGAVNATINSPIAGTVGLTKNGTGTLTLGGTGTYTGKTTIAAGTLTLGASNALPTTTTLQIGTFTGSGTGAVSNTTIGNLNLGAFSQTVGSLYTFSKSSTTNTITIASGQSLTVSSASGTGTLTAFGAYDAATQSNHSVTFTGGGSFIVNTPSAAFQVGQDTLPSGFPAPTTFGSNATVNMSALSVFTATVSDFRVGDFTGTTNNGSSTLTLAPTSTITTTNFVVASGRSNGATAATQTVNLGTGANTINANNITIGGSFTGIVNPRSQGTLKFLDANGTLTIRAKNGTGAANLFLGVQSNGSGTFARNNSVNLDFHTVDLLFGGVQVGGFNGGATTPNANPVNGVFSFTQGTVTATSLLIGFRSGTSSQNNTGPPQGTVNINGSGSLTVTASGTAIFIGSNTQSNSFATSAGTYATLGTLAIGGGTLTLPNGGITLATNTGTFAGGSGTFSTTGILNVFGGTVTVGGDIINGSATSPGTSTATLTLNAAVTAVLDLNGHRIGGTTAASTIDNLTLQAGTLQNVLEINNGAGLTKNTTGTLTLAGTNTYTGATSISNGTLLVGSTTAIPTGATAGNVVLNGGAAAGILDLAGISPTINGLGGATGTVLGQVLNSTASTTSTLTVGNNNASATFAGIIRNNGGTGGTVALTKTGTGTQTLSGANAYTGATTVDAGTLSIGSGGSLAAGSAVAVNNSGTLEGAGTVGGSVAVNNGGTVAGGVSGVGTLTIGGSLTFVNGSRQSFRITSSGSPAADSTGGSSSGTIPNPSNNNFIDIGGSFLPTGDTSTYQFVVDATGATFTAGQTYSYQVGRVAVDVVGPFVLNNQSQFSAIGFGDPATFSLSGNGAGAVYLNVSPVPEPATVLGLAAGVLGVGRLVRRRVLSRA